MSLERWRDGNRLQLLENGEEFFPRVFAAIRAAEREVLIETFILFDDPVGRELRDALIEAAARGVRVELTLDHYGSPDLSNEFVGGLTQAGVRVHFFDPKPKLFGYFRTNLLRRLHRKIVVIDRRLGFIGGLNYSYDHLRECGPEAKQDYAVEVEGPVVDDLHALVESALPPVTGSGKCGPARALLVVRDNDAHRDDIEQYYRAAIHGAGDEVIIANAYFLPSVRLLREMRRAARRGVRLVLILQGQPDKLLMRWAALALYDYLLRSGARIYEYCERPLHGKVALIDDEWATIGSSNLDPLSLSLNLEANLLIRDRAFNRQLRARLQELIDRRCREIRPSGRARPAWWTQMLVYLVFRLLRRFPRWASALPQHRPAVTPAAPLAIAVIPEEEKPRRRAA